MSAKAKREIESTLQKLGVALIDEALQHLSAFVPAGATHLDSFGKFVRSVQYCALQRFEKTLPVPMKKQVARSLGVTDDLAERLGDVEVDLFVNSAGTELLRAFAERLNLEDAAAHRDILRRNVADEIMLTGTECFLGKLPTSMLLKWCETLDIGATERARTEPLPRNLVEELMVYIFQLDPVVTPLAPVEAAAAAASPSPKEQKRKSTERKSLYKPEPKPKKKKLRHEDADAKIEAKEKEKEKEKEEEEMEEEEKPERKTKSKKKKKKDTALVPQLVGRYDENGQWICPSFDRIIAGEFTAQGLYDNFNMDDLARFCKEHDIKMAKKVVVIRRILEKFPTI